MVLSAGTLTTGSVILPAAAPTPTATAATPTAVNVTTPWAVPYSPANPTPSLATVGSSSSPGGAIATVGANSTTTAQATNTFAPTSVGDYSTLNSSTPSVTNLPTSLADFFQNPLYMGVAGVIILLYIRSK